MSTKAGPATPGTAAAPATATAAVPSHSVEYNHQHFTGLINQLVDASLNEEAKLKAAQEISYNLEVQLRTFSNLDSVMSTKAGPATPGTAAAPATATAAVPSHSVEYNHQHFTGLINQLVDASLNEEAKLKAAQEISYNLETMQTLSTYAQLIDDAMLKFIQILKETEPQFIAESAVQQLRKKILELIQRITPSLSSTIQLNIPGVEQRNAYLKDLLMLMYTLIEKENEENVLICLKIMVDFHRTLKQFVVTNEGQQFFTFVKNSYRNLPLNLETIFNYKPQLKVPDINEMNLETIINKVYTSFQLVAERPNQRENQICTVIPKGSRSLKVLAECPLNTVIMYQANKNYLNQEVGEMITLISNAIALQPTAEQRLIMDNKEVYTDFVTAQVKALSFIAYFKSNKESSNNLKEKIASHSDLIVRGMLQLLSNCPPELVGVRKDLLAVSRHILTELRAKFMPHIALFFDEATFCGTGYTASELLKSNACSMVADFVHNVRKQLTHADLCKAVTFFSKSLHDPLLYTNMQHMCCRVLVNLIECIKARDQENTSISTRDMILKLLQVIALKFKSIAKYQVAYLLEASNSSKSDGANASTDVANEEAKTSAPAGEASADGKGSIKQQMEKLESFLGSFEDKDRVKLKYGPSSLAVLSESDCRTTIRYLIAAARSSTSFLVDTKLAQNDLTPIIQMKQLTSKEIFVFVKLLKYALLTIDIYMIGRSGKSGSTANSTANQKEEKEIIESLGFIFNNLNTITLKEIFTQSIDFIIERTFKNPNIAILSSYFLATPTTSFTFATILIEHLLKNMETMGESSLERSNLYLKLFKLVFGSVSVLPAENEKMLKPHLHTLVTKSLEYALKAKEPYNYFLLLRALFRSIGGGNHDLLYQEFLPLLPILLQSLNELQIGLHKQHLKDLFVELCLTVPVRLSSLLPYLPMLMDPLVSALNGSPNLVSQGLRTLELCVDNLQPDFLYDHIQPVRTDLIQGLWRTLRSPNESIAQAAYRVLGKLGGSNRKMMIEPQKLKYNANLNNCREFNGPTIRISFPNYPSSIELSLEKVLETCQQVLKTASTSSSSGPSTSPSPPSVSSLSSASFLTHEIFYKKHAFKIVASFLMSLVGQDSDRTGLRNLFQNFTPFAGASNSFTQKLLKMKFDDEHMRHMVEMSFSSLFYAAVSTSSNKEFQKQAVALLDTLVAHLTLLSLSYYSNYNQEAPSNTLSSFANYNIFSNQTAPAPESTPSGNRKPTPQNQQSPSNILDFMIIVDSIYNVLCHDDMEYWPIVQRAVLIMVETSEAVSLGEAFDTCGDGSKPEWQYRSNLVNLALFDYLAEKLCQLCYERSWFAKRAGCIVIKLLTKKMPLVWTLGHCYSFLRSIMFILVSVIGEISSGAIDVAQESLENLINICATKLVPPPGAEPESAEAMQHSDAENAEPSKTATVYKQCVELQSKCLNEIVKELIRQITSSNMYVRKNSIKMIRLIAELQSKSVYALVNAHLDVLMETVAPRKHLKLRHYSVQAQIGLLEGLEFCSSSQPQLFVFNMSQPDHSSLFQELMPICEGDENFLSKNICYKQNPNDLIPLRKAALNTFASFHHLLEQREHILSSLHRALASPVVEIQQTSFECLKRYIANTEAYSTSLRNAANQSQQPNPVLDKLRQTVQIAADYLRDYLHPLTEYKSLNVSVMQHLTYITQLYPTILNEKFSEYLLTHLRQWLDDANKIANENAATAAALANQGQVFNPSTQFKSFTNELKLCASIIKLLAELQSAPSKLVETAISMLIKYEKIFMLEVNELFRAPLAQFLKRYPYETLKHLLNPDRIKDMYLYRFLIYLVKKQPAFMNIFKTDPNRLMQMLNESQNLLVNASANAALAAELTFKSNQLQFLSILILYRLVKSDETGKPETPAASWTANRAQLIDFLLNKIWTNERFHERHRSIDQLDHLYWKEPVYLVKIFLKFHTAQMKLQESVASGATVPPASVYPVQANVELIFNLLVALQYKSIHQYEFLRLFFQDVVAKTYSCEWKRAAFFTFVKLFNPTPTPAPTAEGEATQSAEATGEKIQFAYSAKLKANILQYILIPCFQHSFEANEHAKLIGGQPQPDHDSDDNIISVFINKVIDPDNPYSISDSVRIFLLQLSSLFVQYAHDYIHDVNNKKQGTKLRRLMTFAWPCLLAKTCVDPFNKYHGHLLLSHIISKFAIHKRIVLQVFHSLLKAYAPEAKVVVRQALDILTPSFPTRMDEGYLTLATWTRKILIEESHTMPQLSHMLYIIVKYHKVYYLIRHALINNMISSFQKVGLPIQSAIENRVLAVDLTEIILRWEAQRIKETHLLESAGPVKTPEQLQLEALIQKHPDMLKPFDKHVAECVLNFYIRLACPISMPTGDQQQQSMANTSMDALSKRCFSLFQTAVSNNFWPYADLRLDYIEKILLMLEQVNATTVTNLGTVGTSAIQVPWLTPSNLAQQPQQPPNYSSICTSLELITFLIETYSNGGGSNSTGTFLNSPQTRLKVQNILRLVQRGISQCIMCSNVRVVRSVAQMVQKLMTIIPVDYFNHNPISAAPNPSLSPGGSSGPLGAEQTSPSSSQQAQQPNDPIYQLFGQPDGILCRTIVEGISYYEKASSSSSISSTISSISSGGGMDAGAGGNSSLSSSLIDTLTNCLLLLKSASANNPQYIDRLMAPFMKILQKLYRDHLHSTGVLLQTNMAVHSSSTTQEGSNFMYIPAAATGGAGVGSMAGMMSGQGQHVNAWSELLIQSLELIKYRVGVMSIEMRKMFISSILVTLIDKSIDLRVIRYITRMIADWIKYKSGGPLMNQIPSMKEKLVLLQKLATAMEKRFLEIGDLQHTFLELIAFVYKEEAYASNNEFKIKLEPAFLSGLKCSNPVIRQQFFEIFNANFNCTDLYERLCYIIVTQNWEPFMAHYWIKQCIQITLGTCARSDTGVHYNDLCSNRFYFSSLLNASTSLFQSAQEIAAGAPHGKNGPEPQDAHVIALHASGDDTFIPQSTLPIVMGVDPTFGENSSQIWKTFSLRSLNGSHEMSSSEGGDLSGFASKRFIELKTADEPMEVDAKPDMMEVDSTTTTTVKKTTSRADLIRFLVDNEFALYDLCKDVKNSDLIVSICQLCHISSDMSHHLWLQLFIQMFNLLNTKQQQNLYGELTPFMASGSHRFQKQTSISTLNTFLESFALAKPVSLFLRPTLLAYLAKNHNLWHRVCLLLESSIFSNNAAPSTAAETSISASSIALINCIESIASQDSASTYQQQTQQQTALQNVQHETFSSLVLLYKQLKEDDYKAGLWMKKSNHETTRVALIYEQQGLFYQAQKIYEEAIARSIDLYLNVGDSEFSYGGSSSNPDDLLEFNTWEDGWIHCCKELNQWTELSEYALSKETDNSEYALSLECAWKTPSQQQQQTSMSDWIFMKQLLLSPQRDSSNMPREQMWRWWLYQGYYLVCNPDDYHQFMLNDTSNRQDQTQSSALQASNSAAAYSSPSSVIESRVERCMSTALREWRRLPRLVSHAHMQLLQAAQQIVELQEAFQIQNNLNTLGQLSQQQQQTHHINPSSILSEIKSIIKTWRTRLPLINDDLSHWNEIFTWRQYHYEAFTRFYEKQQAAQSSGNPAMLGVHALAQGIVHFGKIARKQHLYDLCLETLNKIHKKQSVPIIDCFLKVKQEIKCYINTFEYLNHKQANDLLEVIEATNLRYFTKENVAELISLKANYLQLCGKSDDANHLYSFSIYLNDAQAKLWGAWGDYLTQAYVSVCSTSLTPANAILTAFQRRSVDTAESALIALLHAARHPNSECKVRKYIAKIFWLLTYDDSKRQLYSTLDLYSLSIPSLHWINWIPQLITILSRNDDTGKYVINIMNQIVRSYPLALYYPLRSLYLKMKNEEQAEKLKLQFQQQLLMQHQQQQANAGSDVEMRESTSLSSSPSTGRTPSTPQSLLQANTPASESLIRVTTLMHRQKEMHPTLFNTLEGLIDQLLWLKVNWYEELLRNFKQTLQACYTYLFELTSSHHHTQLRHPLGEVTIDPFTIVWFKKLHKFYADAYWDKLQMSRPNAGTASGSELNNLINSAPSTNNPTQRFRGLFAVLNDPNYQLTRQRFMADFNFVQSQQAPTGGVPAPLTASVNIYAFVSKLRVWIKLFETYISTQMPKQQQLDERFKFVTQFCSTTADIEIPGEFLIPRNTNYYVRISRILPKVDAVEKYNSYTRRIYIRGHNGKLYPFLIANEANYYECRKEEHVMQLMRMMNTYLGKQKETSTRNLHFQMPRIVSLSVDIRMIEDDCSAISLLDIYKNRMRKLSAMMALNPPKPGPKNVAAAQENRALLASEAGDLPLMRYFERLQAIPTLPAAQPDTPTTNKQQNQFEKQLKQFNLELFKHISTNLVPKTVLKDWAMFTYTDATDYFHFRKMFTHQLAIYGLVEHALHLTRLNPDQLYISQDSGVCQNIRFKFDLNEPHSLSTTSIFHANLLKQGQQPSQQINGFNPDRPVAFRLTPNISEFITLGGINGPLSIVKIALVRCLLQPQYNFIWLLRAILKDDILTCYNRRKQEEAMKNPGLNAVNAANNNNANANAQAEQESENLVNLVNKLVDQIENKLKECGGLEGGKNQVINSLIPKSMNNENLAQMDPLFYPWL